jgi:hypothetical protein
MLEFVRHLVRLAQPDHAVARGQHSFPTTVELTGLPPVLAIPEVAGRAASARVGSAKPGVIWPVQDTNLRATASIETHGT